MIICVNQLFRTSSYLVSNNVFKLQFFCVTFLLESDVFLALSLRINFCPVNTSAFLLLVYIITVIWIHRSAVRLLYCLSVSSTCHLLQRLSGQACVIHVGHFILTFCTCDCLNTKPRCSPLFKLVQLDMAAIIVDVIVVYIMKMTSYYIDVTFWRAAK